MNDSSSSDWGSDCQTAAPMNKPMILLEKKSTSLELNEELLIKQYQDDFTIKSTTFAQNTQIQTNFCKFKNSKWVTETDIIGSINKKVSLDVLLQARDTDLELLEDTLKFVIKFNGKVDIRVIFDILRRFKFEEMQEQDQCLVAQILKHLVRFVTSENIGSYRQFFAEYCLKTTSGYMHKYCKAIFAISMIDNIELLQNNDVKSNIKTMRDILLSIDNLQEFFNAYDVEDSFIYFYKGKHQESLTVQIIIEITQAIIAIQNYYSPVSFAQLNDDYLLKYIHRYFKLKKTEQESQLASSSLECDKDCFITQDGERNVIVEILGRQLGCSILLLSFSTFPFDRRYIVSYLQSYALAGAFVQDFFSNSDSDRLLTSEPMQQVVIQQNIEIMGDIIAAGNYNISGLSMLVQYIPGQNLIKANVIQQNLLQNWKFMRPQLKQHLITQFYYLLKEIGDYDTILSFLLSLFQMEQSILLCKLIAWSFDSILQYQIAQAFYCMALSQYDTVIQLESLSLESFDEQLVTQYPKTHAGLVQLGQLRLNFKKKKLESLDMELFNIYYQRILNYEKQNNVESAIKLAQQLIDLKIDSQQRNKLLPKLCSIYTKFSYATDPSSIQYLESYEQLIIHQLRTRQDKQAVRSLQIYFDFLLKQQQFITVLLAAEMIRRGIELSDKLKTMAQMYEVYALFCMSSYSISCHVFQVWARAASFQEPVFEDLHFGRKFIQFLVELTKTSTVLQPYEQIFKVNLKKNKVSAYIPDRATLIGALYYSVNQFLKKSSFQIQQQKIVGIRITFCQLMLDLQVQEGILHKAVTQFSIEYDGSKGFYFMSRDSFVVEPFVIKNAILQITKHPAVDLFQNLQILLLYLKYWMLNDVTNSSIDMVFRHCGSIISEAFLLYGNVLFGIFSSKQFYLVQVNVILKAYLELLLISNRPMQYQDYQIIDAFVKLEYQMKNSLTHDYWPSRTKDGLLQQNKHRTYTHSLSPELHQLVASDDEMQNYLRLMQRVEQIYASITFQQESYRYFSKQFVKKQRSFEVRGGHIQFTIYEESIDRLQLVNNQFYKYQIKTYFEQLERLRAVLRSVQQRYTLKNLLVALKLDNYVFLLFEYQLIDVLQLSQSDAGEPARSQSYYNELGVNQRFIRRRILDVGRVRPLLRQINESSQFELDPMCMFNDDFEIPLNETENQLIVDYLAGLIRVQQKFTHVLPSFFLHFLPFERIFKGVHRVLTISQYNNLVLNAYFFNKRVIQLINFISTQNKQAGCTFSEKKVFNIQGTSYNVYGSKMRLQQDTQLFVGRFFQNFTPSVAVHQVDIDHATCVARRKTQYAQFLTSYGNTRSFSTIFSQFPLSSQLLKPRSADFVFQISKGHAAYSVERMPSSIVYSYPTDSEYNKCAAVQEILTLDDQRFVSWLSSAKPQGTVPLDVSAFGKVFMKIYLLDIADFFEMTDFVMSLLSVYGCRAVVFLAGRDFVATFNRLSGIKPNWNYFAMIDDLHGALAEVCQENYIVCV